jgi:hypothetical protein
MSGKALIRLHLSVAPTSANETLTMLESYPMTASIAARRKPRFASRFQYDERHNMCHEARVRAPTTRAAMTVVALVIANPASFRTPQRGDPESILTNGGHGFSDVQSHIKARDFVAPRNDGAARKQGLPLWLLLTKPPQNKNGGVAPAVSLFSELFSAISAGAEARSAATGWPAPARRPRSTGGSTAPGCWPLLRWDRPGSGWTSRSAAR